MKCQNARIIESMPMAEYLAAPGLSKHGLDLFAECPEKYQLKRSGLVQDNPSDAMLFGRCVHSAVFENRREYYVKPETYPAPVKHEKVKAGEINEGDPLPWNGSATFCKQWEKAHRDLHCVSKSDDDWISAVCSKVRSEPRAAQLLAAGHAELSLFAECDETGLALKGRPDWCSLDFRNVVDLKTISDASPRNCEKEIANRRYHVQAAMYFKLLRLCGKEPENFYFIFVETGNAAPLLNVRKLGNASLHLGEAILADELNQFRGSLAADYWPGYSGGGQEIQDVDVPNWAFQPDELLEME